MTLPRVHTGYAVLATLIVFAAALIAFQRQTSNSTAPLSNTEPAVEQHSSSVAVQPNRPALQPKPLDLPLTGVARVIDGDTIDIRGTRIRLDGIDAPETKQICEANDKKYPCGLQATEELIKLTGANPVECTQTGTDRYARVVARCKLGATDVGSWMVEHGWAVAFRKYSMAYVDAENHARSERLGIWSGTFAMPEEWRKRKREGSSNEQQ